jgi:hypothetical protein
MASAPSPDRPYSLPARNVPLAHRRLMRNGELAGLAGAFDIKIVTQSTSIRLSCRERSERETTLRP